MKNSSRLLIVAVALLAGFGGGCEPSSVPDASTSEQGSLDPASQTQTPAEALARALADPDPYARARNLGALLPELGTSAVPAVIRSLDKFRLGLGAAEFELLLRFWATHQPAEAADWTLKKARPTFRAAGARTVIEVWAASDPAAALEVALRAYDETDEETARVIEMSLVRGWFRADRPELEQYIYGMGSGIKQQRALYAYLLSLASAEGSQSVIQWGESIPEDDARYKLAVNRQVIAALTWADMPAALAFCDAHCDGPYGSGLRNVLIRTWLRRGDFGGDIVAWAGRAPESNPEQLKNKKHSVWVAYSTWAYREREAAIGWLKSELTKDNPEPWVGLLYAEYARQIAANEPEEAIRWAGRVEDENDRELTLVRIARFWRTRDQEAAEAWLEQSPLSEIARQRVRNTNQPINLPGVAEKDAS